MRISDGYVLNVRYDGNDLIPDICYTVEQDGETLTVKGTGFYSGETETTISDTHTDEDENDMCDDCGCYVSGNFFTHLLFCVRKMFDRILDFFR